VSSDDDLIAVARAIAARLPVDWASVESTELTDEIRASLRELKVIAEIAALHGHAEPLSPSAASAPLPQPPQGTWGPLIILEHVAQGSFGDVYRAIDTRLDREVALKLLRRHDGPADPIGSTVIEEARRLARVRHPSIVTIYGADRVDGRVGLWMEFVRGRTLEQVLQDGGPLAPADVAAIGLDICRALAAVHGVGLLHRDIKAHNVMRQGDGRLVVMDFGAGCDVADDITENLAGTPLYLAPEILEGRPATARADVYSVGVLLYRLLAGSYPVTGRTLREIRECHRAGRRAALRDSRPDLPDGMNGVIDRALAVNPDDRFASADDMAEALAATARAPERRLWRADVVVPALVATFLLVAGVGAAVQRWTRADAVPQLRGTEPPSAGPLTVQTRRVWTAENIDRNLAPSPDGRYLGFTDWDTGDLAVRDLVTGKSRRLTNTGGWVASGDYASDPVIAPDGQHIAYEWFVEKAFKNELRLASLAGGKPVRPTVVLRTERNDLLAPFAWTPDGTQLLVVRSRPDRTHEIGAVAIQGGAFRRVKALEWRLPDRLSLSRDGRYIAYDAPAGDSGSARDVFVLAIDGSRDTAVVESPANDSSPLWSPDGSQLVFLSDRTGSHSLWTVPIEHGRPGGPPAVVKTNVGRMIPLGMTKSGLLHYFVGAGRALYVADLDRVHTTTPPVLANEQFIDGNVGPAWSRDGQYLAHYSLRDPAVLVVRATRTGDERTVRLPARVAWPFAAGPKWFPDHRSVLVLSRDAQGSGFGFYRLTLDTGHTELLAHLTGGVSSYDLSPDGQTIFYIFQNALTGRLMRFDIDSRRETELKKNEWFIALAVSPDGTQLAYLKSVRAGMGDTSTATAATFPSVVEVMPAAGGPSREVFSATPWLTGARYNALAWTPDQRFLLFVQDDWALWKVPVLGGEAQKVGISRRGLKSPAVHPDGTRIAFTAFDPDKSEVWALENFLPIVSR
jgi:serine/threonine-protein kinase